jgi:conjugal transfer/type IV secretion protein DotA/TraY
MASLFAALSFISWADEPQTLEDLDQWLSSDLLVGVSGAVDSNDTPKLADYNAPAPITPAQVIGSPGQLTQFLDPANTLVRTINGKITEPCVATSCTPGSYIAYIDKGDGTPIPVQLNSAERGALIGIHAAKSGEVDAEALQYFTETDASTRIKAAALAEASLSKSGLDDFSASQVKAQIEDGYGVLTDQFGGSVADSNYRVALQADDLNAMVAARQGLLDSLATEYMNSGASKTEAYEMARDYIDIAYDQPMLAGLPPKGMPIFSVNEFTDIEYAAMLATDFTTSTFDTLALNSYDDIPDIGHASANPVNAGDILLSPNNPNPGTLADAFSSIPMATGIGSVGVGTVTGPTGITVINPSQTGGTVSTASQPLGDPYGWLDDIQLNKSDIIYVSLKRLIGGPIETVYDSIVSSDGTFRASQGGLVQSDAPATATTFMVTSLLFFVMMLTALMIFYIFIYGGYKTAQQGQLFGKEWNSFWVPARSLGSAAMIIPIDAVSGMSGAQVLVIMVILFGTAFASTLAFYSFRYLMSMPVVEPAIVQNDNFVSSVAKARACIKANQVLDRNILANPTEYYFDASGSVISGSNNAPEVPVESATLADQFLGMFSFGASGMNDPLSTSGVTVKEKNRYIASTFKETGYNPRIFGITRYQYGKYGECGTVYVPELTKVSSGFELDKDISLRLYGKMRSRGGKILGRGGDDAEEAEMLSTVLQSAKNDGVDFFTTFDQANKDGGLWLNSMRAARFTTIKAAYSKLDSDIALSIEEFYKGASTDGYDPDDENAKFPIFQVGELAARLTLAQEDFYQILSSGLQESMTNIEDPSTAIITGAIRQLGWPAIGTFYWLIEHRQTDLMKLFDFSDLATGSPAHIMTDSDNQDEVLSVELTRVNSIIDRSIGPTGIRLIANTISSAEAGVTADAGSLGSSLSGMVTSVFLEGSWFADIHNLNVSPIERVRHLGVVLTNSYYATYLTIGMAGAFANASGEAAKSIPLGLGTSVVFVSKLAKGILDTLGTMFKEVASPILTGAFICANIIPALPYVMLMAAVFGYLVYCLEALVGVNFWFVNHGNPEGHEVFGKGGDGYPILMTLFLRPTLIVVGFVIGIGMNWVFGHLINVTILPATNIQNMEPDGFLGNLSQFAGVIVIYSGMQLFASYKAFSLTHELPNAILRWMGVSDHQDLGEREGKDLAMAIGTGAGTGMGTRMPGGGGGSGPKPSLNKENDGNAPPPDKPSGGGQVDPGSMGKSTNSL